MLQMRCCLRAGAARAPHTRWQCERLFSAEVESKSSKAAAVSRVRGTRDLLPDDAEQHQRVVRVLQDTVQRYGFRQIQVPLMEYTDLFSRSLGDGSDIVMKEMYTFKDNSGKSVTLRPEGTAGIVRALVSNNLLYSLPQKLSYNGSMFRYERPQRGRYREFQQFGVEFIGSSGPSVDIEVIALAADALNAFNIGDKVVLELNTLGDAESRAKYRAALKDYFSEHASELSSDSISRLERGSVLRILDSKDKGDHAVIADAPRLDSYLSVEAGERFDKVLRGLQALGVEYRQNPLLVRGLDYYSHTVFEFVEKPQQPSGDSEGSAGGIAVLAGGCYDNLVEMLGGPSTSCIGWAAGVDRLNLLSGATPAVPVSIAIVPVLVGDAQERVLHGAMRVGQLLRQRGLTVHFCHGRGNLKKQMKAAERYGSAYAVILGGAEVDSRCVKVKHLGERREEQVAVDALSSFAFE